MKSAGQLRPGPQIEHFKRNAEGSRECELLSYLMHGIFLHMTVRAYKFVCYSKNDSGTPVVIGRYIVAECGLYATILLITKGSCLARDSLPPRDDILAAAAR